MVIKPPRITYKKVGLNPDYREQALPFDPHKLHMIGTALISLAHYQKDIIHATYDKYLVTREQYWERIVELVMTRFAIDFEQCSYPDFRAVVGDETLWMMSLALQDASPYFLNEGEVVERYKDLSDELCTPEDEFDEG